MKTRPRFACWRCDRTFGKVVDLEGEPVLLLECPFCSAECKVDMTDHLEPVVEVMRGEGTGPESARYELPDRIPTYDPDDDRTGQEA